MKNVTIELDKERTLRLDFNALVAFEEAADTKLSSLGQDMSAKQIRALVWAGLLHEDPDVTLEQVGSQLHLGNIEYISQKLEEVMKEHLPEGDEGNPLSNPNG